jgi:hypothetical protein
MGERARQNLWFVYGAVEKEIYSSHNVNSHVVRVIEVGVVAEICKVVEEEQSTQEGDDDRHASRFLIDYSACTRGRRRERDIS